MREVGDKRRLPKGKESKILLKQSHNEDGLEKLWVWVYRSMVAVALGIYTK